MRKSCIILFFKFNYDTQNNSENRAYQPALNQFPCSSSGSACSCHMTCYVPVMWQGRVINNTIAWWNLRQLVEIWLIHSLVTFVAYIYIHKFWVKISTDEYSLHTFLTVRNVIRSYWSVLRNILQKKCCSINWLTNIIYIM